LRAANLRILDVRRHQTLVGYEELGDLVMNLIRTPWEVLDFDPLGADLDALLRLEEALARPLGVVLTEARAVIEARKVS
jgi:hypothetical protein